MSTPHRSILKLHLPPHRIEYTGLNAKEARQAANKARALGQSVHTTKALVVGSRLFHYTVVSTPKEA